MSKSLYQFIRSRSIFGWEKKEGSRRTSRIDFRIIIFSVRWCCVSKPAAAQLIGENERDIFIYSVRIEPSIFDFSVEILCKLYNIGSTEGGMDSGGGDTQTTMPWQRNEKWRNGKLLNSTLDPKF